MARNAGKTAPDALFLKNLQATLKKGARILYESPKSSGALMRVVFWQRHAARCRAANHKKGVAVPPVLIFGLTSACNLRCRGCYSNVLYPGCGNPADARAGEMDARRYSAVFREAEAIGVSVLMLAGGEPLLRPDVLLKAARHKNLLTLVFTNGTLLNEERAYWFSRHRNVVPVISLEGSREYTDARRGEGVYDRVLEGIGLFRALSLPFGLSVTATSENMEDVTSDAFAQTYARLGCRAFLYVESVPVGENDRSLALTPENKTLLLARCRELESRFPALFIPFPGDESVYGGCLASGRGFAYVGAGGELTPCPFAPVSDSSLKELKLKKALSSPLLKTVRENRALLREGEGGCALRSSREWLQGLVKK